MDNRKVSVNFKKAATASSDRSRPAVAPVKARKILLNAEEETQVRKVNGLDLKFTNLNKFYWPKEKITKRDLLLEVLDDSHAIIQHPATNGSGIAAFEGETDLKIQIVGTFSPGFAIPLASRYCFQYDSAAINLLRETLVNESPVLNLTNEDINGNVSFTRGFDLARVKSDGVNLFIQDKRSQIWETKGSNLPLEISRAQNPLIGIEAAKWNDYFSPGDRNIGEVAWGMRSDNWAIDSAKNIVT